MENKTVTPFAMRCTQEQFDDVKEELKKYQRVYMIFSFNDYPVLYSDEAGVTNTKEWYCKDNSIPLYDWDKSLFLKMAGKPEPESRELIGYKRNSELGINLKHLCFILGCHPLENPDGLFFWGNNFKESKEYIRSCELGIVGEGKWLVPVYRQKEKTWDQISKENLEIAMRVPELNEPSSLLNPDNWRIAAPQSEIDRIKETAFIRGTPEWQKAVKEIDVNKEPISEQLLRTLSDTEVHYMAQNGRLNISDYMRYLDLKRCNKVWSNKTDTTNMKPTQYSASYSSRITGTYEQQKGGEG